MVPLPLPDLLVYRIQKKEHRLTALSGEGARLYGGRWNVVHTPLVYASTNPELTLLEIMVHLNGAPLSDLPPFELLTLRLPAEVVEVVSLADLPPGWNQRRKPYPDAVPRFLIPRLLPADKMLAFAVPSVILPGSPSLNVLINPLHPRIAEVEVLNHQAIEFDDRL